MADIEMLAIIRKMKQLILIIVLLQSSVGQSQGVVAWPSDTIVTELGDTTFMESITLHPLSVAKYFDGQGNVTQSNSLIAPDTVKLSIYYKSGAIKEEYYTKLSVEIDTILEFNPEWPGHKTVGTKKYCENGTVRENNWINTKKYEVYACNGNLWIKADSCNEYLMPLGTYTMLDTLTGEIHQQGQMKVCSFNRFTCCQQGWWDTYENGILFTRELFDDGWSKEIIDYR